MMMRCIFCEKYVHIERTLTIVTWLFSMEYTHGQDMWER